MKEIIAAIKYVFGQKNGDCNHEKLWKTKSGYCYVCQDSIPLERALRMLEVSGKLKRIKEQD